jgi:beta-aspartyl-peptidase (threonine type)
MELRNLNYGNRDGGKVERSCTTSIAGRTLALALALSACRTGEPASDDGAIRALLARQVERWNAGDLTGFMDGYERSERLRFHSGGEVHTGWQTMLDRYRHRYGSDRAGMGLLTFSELQVETLAADAALAHGRWRVTGAAAAHGAELSGLFTLVLRKGSDGWKIRYDHTSSSR